MNMFYNLLFGPSDSQLDFIIRLPFSSGSVINSYVVGYFSIVPAVFRSHNDP